MVDIKIRLRRLFSGKEEPSPNPTPAHERPSLTAQELLGDENNDFALAMYDQLRRQPGNLFFSPFSIRSALCMIEAGARGETAAQMREALRLSSSADMPRTGLVDIVQRLNLAGYRDYEMEVANSLWAQEGAPLLPEFVDLIARQFDGRISPVDFHVSADAACREINRWVEDKTRQRIQNLIPPGSLNSDTRLVLVNAVYFKGTWVLKFEERYTSKEPFYLDSGGKVQVPLMYQREEVRYFRASSFQAVDLIYEGDDLSMLVILPDKKEGLRDIEKLLSTRMLRDCVDQMDIREVKLFLPRFKTTWEGVDMSAHLGALGMPLAFKPFQADFSGINGFEPPDEKSLYISAAFHKAFVDVYEEGTEAAAATGVIPQASAALYRSEPPPIPIFRADHPFLFAIRDRKSGTILFLGRMVNPTLAS